MACTLSTLLANAGTNGFTGLSDRELKIAVLELLCESSGGFIGGSVTKTSAYTATANDYLIRADTTAAGFTVLLPASPNNGQVFNIKKISSDGNTLTISGNGNNIDGAATVTTSTQYAGFNLVYDLTSTTWNLI